MRKSKARSVCILFFLLSLLFVFLIPAGLSQKYMMAGVDTEET